MFTIYAMGVNQVIITMVGFDVYKAMREFNRLCEGDVLAVYIYDRDGDLVQSWNLGREEECHKTKPKL